MSVPLTPRQTEALRFIERHIAEHGVAPTFEQMRVGFGCASKGSVFRLLARLEERGHIRRLPRLRRAIEVLGAAQMDPADAALLNDVLAATADPLADPVVLRGVTMPRALARRIEAPLLRLRSELRRGVARRQQRAGASRAADRSFHGEAR